jgi:hypothetical protein
MSIEPKITCLSDGTVKIEFNGLAGYVSSYHLVQPKLNQLQAASSRTTLCTTESLQLDDSN